MPGLQRSLANPLKFTEIHLEVVNALMFDWAPMFILMKNDSLHLLRCSHCFVIRIEYIERPCPLCDAGILQITNTKFHLHEIDRTEVQDLLKRLLKTSVSNKQLAEEVPKVIEEVPIVEETKKQIGYYLFCGHSISVPFPSHVNENISSLVANLVSQFRLRVETTAEKINLSDTDSVIAFVKTRSIARSTAGASKEVLRLVEDKFKWKVTNDLICCENCLTLYRSYGLSYCIFCEGNSFKSIQENIIKISGASTLQILTLLIQAAAKTNFLNFRSHLLAFITTYYFGKIHGNTAILAQLIDSIQQLQFNKSSLLQLHSDIYDLLKSFKPLHRFFPPELNDIDLYEERDYFRNRYSETVSFSSSKEDDFGSSTEGIIGSSYGSSKNETYGSSFGSSSGNEMSSTFDGRKRLETFFNKTGSKYDSSLSASVFSPLSATIEESFLVQVFIHEADLIGKVDKLAISADIDGAKRFETTLNIDSHKIHQFDISFFTEDLEVDERNHSVKWAGGIASDQFIATVPKTCTKSNVFCTLIIVADTVPIGQMKFKTKILANAIVEPSERKTFNRSRFQKYKNVFISYASEDRVEVLKRVQILNSMHIDFFQDILNLEPGENWEEILYSKIPVCDAFFLFWSSSAARSDWVKKEIIYALNIKRGKEENPPQIIPVIIEGPPPPIPPSELAFLHFNDKLLYLINE